MDAKTFGAYGEPDYVAQAIRNPIMNTPLLRAIRVLGPKKLRWVGHHYKLTCWGFKMGSNVSENTLLRAAGMQARVSGRHL